MGQAVFHLPDKILKCIENLLCLSEIPLRQKPVLKPSQMDNHRPVHLYSAAGQHHQGLHHQERAYGILLHNFSRENRPTGGNR
jgi:hypothetical protein